MTTRRAFLHMMAAAGARWLQEGDDDEKVYQRIRMVVERIIKEFDDDLAFAEQVERHQRRRRKLDTQRRQQPPKVFQKRPLG